MKKNEPHTQQQQLGTPLTADALLKVKGGYRATPGHQHTRQYVRWDEVDLRFQDETDGYILTGLPDSLEKQGRRLGGE